MRPVTRVGILFRKAVSGGGPRGAWILAGAAVAFAAVALTPAADPASLLPGVSNVSAASDPSPYSSQRGATAALEPIKSTAKSGTAAGSGPSANVGQSLKLAGPGIAAGNANFSGYNGTKVSAPLTGVKTGKKAKVVVPKLAVSGEVTLTPSGGSESAGVPLLIVPTIASISPSTVAAGATLTINGTGFASNTRVVFPGVAEPVAPSQIDDDSATVTVPAGAQKGKIAVRTDGGTSNAVKFKVTSALANRKLTTDPVTGLILVADDVADTLTAVEPGSGRAVATFAIPPDASRVEIVTTPERHGVVVSNDDLAGVYVSLDALALGRVASSPVEGDLKVSVDVNGNLHVSTPDGGMRFTVPLGPGLEAAKVTADNARALVLAGDHGVIYVVDLASGRLAKTVSFDAPIEGVTIGVDGLGYTVDRATGLLLSFPLE